MDGRVGHRVAVLVLLSGAITFVQAQRGATKNEDTLIRVDDHLSFRARKGQNITCLRGYKSISFEQFVRSDVQYASVRGDITVPCRTYALPSIWRECDTVVSFDPPLRVEVAVPPGVSAAMARKHMQMLSEDGQWLDVQEQGTRVQVRKENERLIAVIEVHRLVPRFSTCCGGVLEGMKVRFHFRKALEPVVVTTHEGAGTAGSPAIRRGPSRWETTLNCREEPHLRIQFVAANGSHVYADPALKDLPHRTRFFGKRCRRTGPDRLRRSYIISPRSIGPLHPVLVE